MDAVKFVEEVRRMRSADRNYKIFNYNDKPEDVVKEVEQWSVAHPIKTRRGVFLEQWPEARIDKIFPCFLVGKCKRTDQDQLCCECVREFWSQEVE